ncbi:MAG: circularly permuted type 2 ATP-grasp protein [Paracoccaceae bacterium]
MTGTVGKEEFQQSPLLEDYALQRGVADELYDADGTMRPVWKPFINLLQRLSPEDCAAHFARGDQYLRDAGVFFRQYSADPQQERNWPLSHIPVILHDDEWKSICAGLEQRAELLERVVADLYGDARLVQEGHLPPELVARNPEWHRPLVGITPASGYYLHFLAFEIGRSPDGSWLVLGDRTQAPAGAGFALENRRATSRIYPESFPRSNVYRLAGFFRAFREAMDALPGAEGRLSAILSPGQGNDTYFEHAYIARYLGLKLVEGEDLIVENGRIQIRTVSGPVEVGVLWRRLNAAFADPLELDEASQIGTPGLMEALRQSSVSMVNALHSGILETRAFLAFMPKISEVLIGEPLQLPNIATWWCGQKSERDYVKQNAERMFIGEALSRGLPFDMSMPSALGGTLQGAPTPDLSGWVDSYGLNLVGQEAVTLSTTPAWVEGRLLPRPMSVRVFAARTQTGWTFLPGGYARIGRTGDATALSMQRGGSVADVWIVRDKPVPEETLLDSGNFRREETGTLPSRAADNLYWLGRYVERTEGAVRLLRAYHLRLAEASTPDDKRIANAAELLRQLEIDPDQSLRATLDPMLQAASVCAGKVRDRFSVDGWFALSDLISSLASLTDDLQPGDDSARALRVLLRKISGFNGLVHENMHRTSGWRFLTLGRAVERGDGAGAVLAGFASSTSPEGLAEIALEYGDCYITHQRRYRIDPTLVTVADLMALDVDNPRSILYQVAVIRSVAETLPKSRWRGRVSAVLSVLLPLEAELSVSAPSDITPERLAELRDSIADISDRLSAAYLV